jgi:CheY-like chemotaxis protein
LLLDTQLTPEQLDYVRVIHDSGDALLTIINDVLDYSKIEANRLNLEKQPFDLHECVDASLDLLAAPAAAKGLNLARLIAPDVPDAVQGDAGRLRQILINLISNAVKFTEQGDVVVRLSGRVLDEQRYELHFAVEDTGIGIPPDRMDRLFQSFSQVDASTTRRYGGTGLGLAISKKLCELMGGAIWVESEIGRGSTFHFTIITQVALGSDPQYLHIAQPQLEGKQILLVDDSITNRKMLVQQVQTWRMSVHESADRHEALELIRQGAAFDVALLDIQAPSIDGIELARQIRNLRSSEELPLVALSSIARRGIDIESAGFNSCLTKPIKQSQLYDMLVDLFAGRGTSSGTELKRTESDVASEKALSETWPLHVLLAEDLAVNQRLMLAMLAKLGYQIDVASNGREVLQALEKQRYDVVLMDIQMPEMDGLEATRRILERWTADQRPRLVALTANAMKEDREACMAAGMDDYLPKPVRSSELKAALIRAGQWVTQRRQKLSSTTTVTTSSANAAVVSFAPLEGTEEGAPGAEAKQVLDQEALANLRQMRDSASSDIIRELLHAFHCDSTPLLAAMREAIDAGNPVKLKESAHALKGVAGNLGGRALAALCAELEKKGSDGTTEDATILWSAAEVEVKRLGAALEAESGGEDE